MRKARTNRVELRREISSLLGKVSFSQTAVRLCEQKAAAPQEQFLLWILKSEIANREQVRRARFLREATFPVYKTLEGFEFTSVKLPPSLSKDELCSGAFIAEKKNLVLYGPVGTGKTHLASALGVLACSQGIRTRFFTAAELVVRLSEAFAAGTLEKLLKNLLRADLLIIDEWGYVPVDRQGAQLLFRIISDSYERRSVILTTNLEFSKWGAIFTDDQMAAAMIDRLAHHGYILLFEGESYRMKHALMRQKGQAKIPTS
jgi:DNA replication protein DnaC